VESSNGPGTGEHLATVSYLFGAPASSEPEPEPEARPEAAVGQRPGPSAAPDLAAPAAGGSSSASGWYLEPGAAPPADAGEPEEPGEPAEPEPEAIAAARRFLAAVGAPASAPVRDIAAARRAPGPRFEESEPEPEPEVEPEPVKPPAVRRASINALARKGMSSAEMTSLLESREIEPDEVAAEVARLEEAGLLDDRVLAEDLVQTLRDRKGLGKSAITAELRRRRVDQAAIDEALETVDVDDELERATEVAIKRAGQLSSYDRQTAERRLSAFLQRRGYSGSVVGAAVSAALGPVGPRFR
jgi:regulatory protein